MKSIVFLLIGLLFVPHVTFAAPVVCECVRALRELRGVDIRGNAWTIRPNTDLLSLDVGDVIVFDYGRRGPSPDDHVGLIIGFDDIGELPDLGIVGPSTIVFEEWNYKRCQYSIRRVNIFDSDIKGIYHP